jgi:hypothetical protein
MGTNNTATGVNALSQNTTGSSNAAAGIGALAHNTTGIQNTANGANALAHNTIGTDNTANGQNALLNNTSGGGNIALGAGAGSSLTTGSNNIEIGNVGMAGESSRIRIGHAGTQTSTFIAGISGATVTGTAVVVNSSGQLGVAPSSERFKEEIKPMDKASEAILALKPVTFRYKREIDPNAVPQFGLVAEEVDKVDPDLVMRDAEGEVNTVRYDAVNAMLLNEFLKEHRKVEGLKGDFQAAAAKQEAIITQQKKRIDVLTARLDEQASLIQKVSAQLALRGPASQTIVNNR